jgi:hypothetical protein
VDKLTIEVKRLKALLADQELQSGINRDESEEFQAKIDRLTLDLESANKKNKGL